MLKQQGEQQIELKETRELALLGLGRLHYGRGEYEEASEAYEAVPRYSRYWDQALFENGFARFQNEDFGGALGSLQALHAPQFAGAFQPESWILKATVYYYSCLFDEVEDDAGRLRRGLRAHGEAAQAASRRGHGADRLPSTWCPPGEPAAAAPGVPVDPQQRAHPRA